MGKKLPTIIGVVIAAALAILAVLYFNGFFEEKDTEETSLVGKTGEYYVDSNGNGEKETVVFITNEETGGLAKITVVDTKGSELASTPEGIGFPPPLLESYQTYKFAEKSDVEFFSVDFIEGPHQFRTMFFGILDEQIYPICKTSETKEVFDCLFYKAGSGYLEVKDIDGDAFVEVVEYVDEYPEKGELTNEELQAVEEGFGDKSEETKVAIVEITQREKGGRGRKVVWRIYSFDGQTLIPQEGDDFFNMYFELLTEDAELISKEDLSEELLEYQEMVQKFWFQGGI